MKIYKNINVYDATQERLKFIFEEFEYIYLSFSGGKDSGLLLNLVIDFMKKNKINKKIGLYHADMECRFNQTNDYVDRVFNEFQDYIIPYWICAEVLYENSFSSNQLFWYPWEEEKKDLWVREMPKYSYIINHNQNTLPFMIKKMDYTKSYQGFAKFYQDISKDKKVACLVGLRAGESLERYRAVTKNPGYKNVLWSTKRKYEYSFYPIYDWTTADLWLANFKYNFDYNKIYDYFTYLGIPFDLQRVAQPFSLKAKKNFNIYQVVDSVLWDKFLKRIDGINSNSDGILNKPNQYLTYKDYSIFLFNTLSKESQIIFNKRIGPKKESFQEDEEFYKRLCRTILNNGIEGEYFKQNKKEITNLKQKTIDKWSN